ncbi:MAG TPA: endo alpha-1,4 polygalactosaminidase [Bacteroidales bacterium]|nr:endo alpha-1,4 polygalactosaminidase [Bacteroidales bacterium]
MKIPFIRRTISTRKIMLILILSVIISGCAKEEKTNTAAEKMQKFVINISDYAKEYDPDFIIIPQNGIELAFNNIDADGELNSAYITAIDGLGVEELFYDGGIVTDDYRLSMLQKIKTTEKIMVSEYVTDKNNVEDAIEKNYNEGFICFTRTGDNYYYSKIPESITNSNTTDITNLSLAQNYLYLISTDNYSSKEDMLNSIAETDYDLILIDLFFDDSEFSSAEIQQLKNKANGGQRLVISYISIGSVENYRYYWKSDWKRKNPDWIKKKYDGYEDEFWIEFWNEEWQNIIYGNDSSYIKKIIDAGFDGVYLDNIEAYYFLYHNS